MTASVRAKVAVPVRAASRCQAEFDPDRCDAQQYPREQQLDDRLAQGRERHARRRVEREAVVPRTLGEDLELLGPARIADVREFFRLYYSPNNASLAIVGDIELGP